MVPAASQCLSVIPAHTGDHPCAEVESPLGFSLSHLTSNPPRDRSALSLFPCKTDDSAHCVLGSQEGCQDNGHESRAFGRSIETLSTEGKASGALLGTPILY